MTYPSHGWGLGFDSRSEYFWEMRLISNKLDEDRPDFMLLNECKIGKAKFNIKGY